jgi:hypothetical protein
MEQGRQDSRTPLHFQEYSEDEQLIRHYYLSEYQSRSHRSVIYRRETVNFDGTHEYDWAPRCVGEGLSCNVKWMAFGFLESAIKWLTEHSFVAHEEDTIRENHICHAKGRAILQVEGTSYEDYKRRKLKGEGKR